MKACPERSAALALLRKYNAEPFHIQHGLTVEGVMRWYAQELGYGEDADFWAAVGLLHDVDFEKWPEAHCKKAPELLAEIGCSDEFIHAVCSHGYGLCSDVEPTEEMEKVLFAADELFSRDIVERLRQDFTFLLPYYDYFVTLEGDPDPRDAAPV